MIRKAFLFGVCILSGALWNGASYGDTFTNFGGFDTDGPNFFGIGRYMDAAPTWADGIAGAALPGWDENVRWEWSAEFTDALDPVGEDPLVLAAPFHSTSTVFHFDATGAVAGTISLLGTGTFDTNLNFAEAVVDAGSGQIFTPYALVETYEIAEQTGSFANIVMDGPWMTEVHGRSARQLVVGQDPAEATTNLLIGSSSTFIITGDYSVVPEPASAASLACCLLLLPLCRRRRT